MPDFHTPEHTRTAWLRYPRSIGRVQLFLGKVINHEPDCSTIVMNWSQRFAGRTQRMKRNAVRELLKLTSQPEMISFAGGLPAAELFPLDRVRNALDAVLHRVGGVCLQYAETEGITGLRDWIAQHCSSPRLSLHRNNVLITAGGQQALDLIGRVLLDEGDRVVVESPTYLALLSAWRPLGVQFLSVPSDEQGMRLDAFEPLLEQRPKLIYLVPNFQNPQGTTLAVERRERIVEWLREKDLALLEDNPYGALRYEGSPLPHLIELDAAHPMASGLDSHVIYTGTFSKMLMPGLRVGWVIADEAVIDKLVQAKQSADLHTCTLSQYLALELVTHGFLEQHLPVLCQAYRRRRNVMLAALDKYFPPGATWTRPDGGMFLLVTLPKQLNATDLLSTALQRKVAFVPGEEFFLNGEGKNVMRLNFSNARPEHIEEGIRRLAAVIAEAMH
jgi:2-aminoadipate transaminase